MDSDLIVVSAGLVFFLLIFVFGAGFGVWHLVRISRLRRDGTRVPGNVVAIDHVPRGRTWVRLSFRTTEGQAVETRFKVRNPQLAKGQDVTVAYDPAKPESVAVLESRQQFSFYVWMVAVSALALVIFGWAGSVFVRSIL